MDYKERLIYLAGIIDGEGHFYKPVTVNGRGEHSLQARIVVNNTSKELIDWMFENFGGGITPMRKQKEHHLQCWRWQLSGKMATQIAGRVKPYLIVKRDQVERVL